MSELQAEAVRKITAAPTSISQAEFHDRDDGLRLEWIEGKVIEMPGVTDEHDDITTLLQNFFQVTLALTGGGRVLRDPMLMKMATSSRAPDLQVLLPPSLGKIRRNYVEGAADLVVEVTSKGSERIDRVEKFLEYERAGVREYWLIDPLYRELLFYVLTEGVYERIPPEADGVYTCDVLPKLRLPLALLWARPLPDVLAVTERVRAMVTPA